MVQCLTGTQRALVPYPDCNSTTTQRVARRKPWRTCSQNSPDSSLSPLALYRFPTSSFSLLTYASLHFSLGTISLPRPRLFLDSHFSPSAPLSLLSLGGISLLFDHLAPLTAQIHPQGASGLPEAHSPHWNRLLKPKAGRTLLRLQFAICCCAEGLKFGL